MTGVSPERMTQLAMQHEQYELDQDVDKIMATLVEYPVFDFFPQGYRVEGRDAVRKMYERLVDSVFPRLDERDKETPSREVQAFALSDSALMAETDDEFRFPDGAKRIRMSAIVHFDGELIRGETTYLDENLATYFDSVLWNPEFLKEPGVSRLI